MECDLCGAKEELVKVKNEDGETVQLCSACYEAQYEGYEKDTSADLDEEDDEDWEEEDEEDGDEDDEDLEEEDEED